VSCEQANAAWAEFFSEADLVVMYTLSTLCHVSVVLLTLIPVHKAASLMSGDILMNKNEK